MKSKLRPLPGRGKTPLTYYRSSYFKAIIRSIQVLERFDCAGLSAQFKFPVGSAYRVLIQLHNVGAVEKNGRAAYEVRKIRRNPDLKSHRFNYGKNPNLEINETDSFQKGARWEAVLFEWINFLSSAPKLRKRQNQKVVRLPTQRVFDGMEMAVAAKRPRRRRRSA